MADYRQLLKQYWGYDDFRPLQYDIIESVCNGKDTLGLMPTGGGKSITFQVPALAMDGLCLVVTPLIALMLDQVENLKAKGIKALAIHSGLTRDEINIALDNCIYGGFKFLYLSPERLATELFRKKLDHMKVNLIAVDEAHCISQWGYDFRPSYIQIAELREFIPDVPVLALTATATPKVVEDIQKQLHFRKNNVFQKSFYRSNIAYVIRVAEDKEGQLLKILNSIRGTAIVYVRNRKKTKQYAQWLISQGMSASWFHAGLHPKVKVERQTQWTSGGIRIMVATNAFGMGIDKPDVRVVVHMTAPDSPEAYFQEAGRAGRDGKKAYAVLLWSGNDKNSLYKMLRNTFPEPDEIKRVYEALGNFFQVAVGYGAGMVFDFDIGRFCKAYKLSVLTVFNSLKILQLAGYIDFTEELQLPSRVHFIIDREELYKFQVANANYDLYIKLLLRSYTGLFAEYVAIDEALMADRAHTSRDEIYTFLKRMAHLKVINYNPQKKTPLITYTQGREELKHLVFRKNIYQERRNRMEQRIDAMVEYATTSTVCRSRLLLAYFGEHDSTNCGICDVCVERKRMDLTDEEFESLKQMIKDELSGGPVEYHQLLMQIRTNRDKLDKVIRWLEDYELMGENEEGKLEWWKDR
jgi:ATP-dependent DNA helicase RecQ